MNPQRINLPTHFAAVRLACDCFGVKMPELSKMLRTVRDREAKADKKLRLRLIKEGAIPKRPFPRKLNRVMLGKAEGISHPQEEGLCTVAYQALHSRIRFEDEKPLFGVASELAERVAIQMPRLYAEMIPWLRTGEKSETEVMCALIRKVFIPTIFLELKRAQYSDQCMGNELSLTDCWYFPKEHGIEREYPFPRVVNAWLNAAGCRYADDVGKLLQSDSKRIVVSNWLKGKNVPGAKAISLLVEKFQKETRRFDEAEAWKARLGFAAAMHRLCKRMDDYFSTVEPRISFKLLGMMQEIESAPMPIDSDEILAERKTFFAARLIWRSLKETDEWKAKVTNLNQCIPPAIPDSATRPEMDQIIGQHQRLICPGNLLLACIKKDIAKLRDRKNKMIMQAETIQEQIFALGIEELNRDFNKRGRQS
jgi:hypothetical protein